MQTAALRPAQPDLADTAEPCLISATGISKSFLGVTVLDRVSFHLKPGSVHALMGENGAGKSTLMKILAGIHQPDHGDIRLAGAPVLLRTPLEALRQGVAMIHQELNLMPSMTIAENIWIGREPRNRLGLVDDRRMRRQSADLLARLRIDLDPDTEVRHLSIANRQLVEIAKAVSYRSRVLIMDEPTSALTEREASHLFAIIGELKAEGVGIVYISHRMNEIFEISDEVTVFRDGAHVGTHATADMTRDDIIRMMVGRELTHLFPKQNLPRPEILLSVRNLALDGVFSGVSFDLRAGEILGLAGLIGSGRSNVAETLFGLTPATGGEIRIRGEPVALTSPGAAIRHGMAFLTEDRKQSGCLPALDVLENMQIAALGGRYVKAGFVRGKALAAACRAMARTLRVKSAGLHAGIDSLSGGNQQKVLIGRWLLTDPRILILDEPTRGIDVAAKAEIHALVSSLAESGAGVILISSEMPEVLGMSDRILVMHEGRITGALDREGASQVKIMELASR